MNKCSFFAAVAAVALTAGCMSDPAVANRFQKVPTYGTVYAPLLSCTCRTLEHADGVNNSWGLNKSDAKILVGSTCRLPFDLVTDVVFLPWDIVRVCQIDWSAMD